MLSLRRLAVTAARSSARPAAPLASSTFGILNATRPQNLSELRRFEVLLQKRWNSMESGTEGQDGAFGYRRLNEQPKPQNSPTKVIYVGNITYDSTEQQLLDAFKQFGKILGVRIPRTGEAGITRGFAYIEFDNLQEAAEAIDKMHQAPFNGRRLNCQYVSRADMRIRTNPESKTLFIGNLSFETTDNDLNELFKDIPGCTDVRVAMDRRTGQPRGFIHADFTDIPSAVSARERLMGTQLYGRTIRIDFSTPPEERERQMRQRAMNAQQQQRRGEGFQQQQPAEQVEQPAPQQTEQAAPQQTEQAAPQPTETAAPAPEQKIE